MKCQTHINEHAYKMIKSKLTIITLLSIVTVLISCNNSTNSKVNENKTTIDNYKEQLVKDNIVSMILDVSTTESKSQVGSKASEFVKNLKAGEKLSSYFNDT